MRTEAEARLPHGPLHSSPHTGATKGPRHPTCGRAKARVVSSDFMQMETRAWAWVHTESVGAQGTAPQRGLATCGSPRARLSRGVRHGR